MKRPGTDEVIADLEKKAVDTKDIKLDVKIEQRPINIDQVECDDTPPNMSESEIKEESPKQEEPDSVSELEISQNSAQPNIARTSAISV